MRRAYLVVAAMLLTTGLIFGLLAVKVPVASNPAQAVQVSREAGGHEAVTVTISRTGLAVLDQPGTGPDLSGMKDRVIPFALALDTHAGDISKVDLNGKLFIRDAAGVEIPGMARQLSTSAHHTTYVAAFPKLDSRGQPLGNPDGSGLTLLVRGVGGTPERVLQWQAGSPGQTGALQRLKVGAGALLPNLGGALFLMLPFLLNTAAFWAVLTAGSAAGSEDADHLLRSVLLYIAGFTVVYAGLGALAGSLGAVGSRALSPSLQPYRVWIDLAAGLAMVGFGLYVTGLLRKRTRLQMAGARIEKPAAFGMGLSKAIASLSCGSGTVFLSLLVFMGASTWWTGLKVSLLYSLVLAVPLLLLTLGIARPVLRLMGQPKAHRVVAILSGGALALFGLLILTGQGHAIDHVMLGLSSLLGGDPGALHIH